MLVPADDERHRAIDQIDAHGFPAGFDLQRSVLMVKRRSFRRSTEGEGAAPGSEHGPGPMD